MDEGFAILVVSRGSTQIGAREHPLIVVCAVYKDDARKVIQRECLRLESMWRNLIRIISSGTDTQSRDDLFDLFNFCTSTKQDGLPAWRIGPRCMFEQPPKQLTVLDVHGINHLLIERSNLRLHDHCVLWCEGAPRIRISADAGEACADSVVTHDLIGFVWMKEK